LKKGFQKKNWEDEKKMLITLFLILLVLSGIGVIYGFFKAHLPIYLLGSGVISLLGIITLNEGLALDSIKTISGGGLTEAFVTTPEILYVTTSSTAHLLGYGCLYGGLFLVGVGIIIAILHFYRQVLPNNK